MRAHKIITTAFGSGYSPWAPGTAGSIVGIVLLYFINTALAQFNFSSLNILGLNIVLIVLVTFLGVFSISKVHKIWEHDAGKIVIDEVVGVWIAALFIPLQWEYYLLALILFRFFDIAKPLFIRKLDNIISDWAVMLDDILAGVYALIVIQIILYFSLI